VFAALVAQAHVEQAWVRRSRAGTFAVLATIPTELRPRAVMFTQDGRKGFVTTRYPEVSAFSMPTKTASSIQLDTKTPATLRPMGMAISCDGKPLYVSTGRGGAVVLVHIEKMAVERIISGVGARPWASPWGWRETRFSLPTAFPMIWLFDATSGRWSSTSRSAACLGASPVAPNDWAPFSRFRASSDEREGT